MFDLHILSTRLVMVLNRAFIDVRALAIPYLNPSSIPPNLIYSKRQDLAPTSHMVVEQDVIIILGTLASN